MPWQSSRLLNSHDNSFHSLQIMVCMCVCARIRARLCVCVCMVVKLPALLWACGCPLRNAEFFWDPVVWKTVCHCQRDGHFERSNGCSWPWNILLSSFIFHKPTLNSDTKQKVSSWHVMSHRNGLYFSLSSGTLNFEICNALLRTVTWEID